jgi:hypothetical protein
MAAPEARKPTVEKPAPATPAEPPTFTDADKSLIRRIHGFMPQKQLLGILNDRLLATYGTSTAPYTIEQLHAEIATLSTAKPSAGLGWAGLRKVLAQAKASGVLARVDEQVIRDFAIVFSLSPKQLMRLKEILVQPADD